MGPSRHTTNDVRLGLRSLSAISLVVASTFDWSWLDIEHRDEASLKEV